MLIYYPYDIYSNSKGIYPFTTSTMGAIFLSLLHVICLLIEKKRRIKKSALSLKHVSLSCCS